MHDDRICRCYPACAVCGATIMFTTPMVRSGDRLIHLDCRDRAPKSN